MGIGLGKKMQGFGKASNAVMDRIIPPMVHREDLADVLGYVENAGAPLTVVPDFIGQKLFDTTNGAFYRAYGTAAGQWAQSGGTTLGTQAGAGITSGVGAVYKSSVVTNGGIINTSILIDLTGLASSTTDLDIIGVGAGVAHIGQITAARNGTILSGRMTCLEVPAGGADDIDLYYATEGTGVFDGLVTDLTEVALITAGGAWTLGLVKGIADFAASANKYLYLTGGEAGTAATYTAGKFLIELQGYNA